MIRPRVSELEFISHTKNHKEISEKIERIIGAEAAQHIGAQALYVGTRWIKLGGSHLREARIARRAGLTRATYSKAYYAAYNYSKGVRYLKVGHVSLRGDDHQSASNLPEDFPNRVALGKAITDLYACRLKADYDNWGGRQVFPMPVDEAVKKATLVGTSVRSYVTSQFGRVL